MSNAGNLRVVVASGASGTEADGKRRERQQFAPSAPRARRTSRRSAAAHRADSWLATAGGRAVIRRRYWPTVAALGNCEGPHAAAGSHRVGCTGGARSPRSGPGRRPEPDGKRAGSVLRGVDSGKCETAAELRINQVVHRRCVVVGSSPASDPETTGATPSRGKVFRFRGLRSPSFVST